MPAGITLTTTSGNILEINAKKDIIEGNVNGDGLGYGPEMGPGAGVNGNGGDGGSGGSYGGVGGSGGGATTPTYGTANGNDIDMGSGGAGSDKPPDAAGGGALKINAISIEINGNISMNGQDAGNCGSGNSSECGGGGSGGGILVSANIIKGAGNINVDGGEGGDSNSKEGGGGGAGGRIKFFYGRSDNFTGILSVKGAQPGSGGQSGMMPGEDGTINRESITSVLPSSSVGNNLTVVAANFSADTVCLGEATSFTDISITGADNVSSYEWMFEIGATSTISNPQHTFTTSGTYNVQLNIETTGGCRDTVFKDVIVSDIPSPDFYAGNGCKGDKVVFSDLTSVTGDKTISSWIWDFGDGSALVPEQNSSHTYSSSGSFNIKMIVVDNLGCSGFITKPINISDNPTADFTVNDACVHQTAQFNSISSAGAGTLTNYSWNFGDNIFSNEQNPEHVYTVYNTYAVQLLVENEAGCKHDTTKNITVFPLPIPNFTSSITEGCQPLSITFTSSSTSTTNIMDELWDFGDGNTIRSDSIVSHTFNSAGIFSIQLTVTSSNGCSATEAKNNFITVNEKPKADFSISPEEISYFNPNVEFTNNSILADSWEWSFGDSIDGSFDQHPTYLYNDTGTYRVRQVALNSFGCSDTAYQVIQVNPEFTAYFPNTFSPNGDGKNDVFNVVGFGIQLEDFQLLIFNRFGDEIFETDILTKGWDGGNPDKVSQEVYVYKVTLKDIKNKKHQFFGKISLIR